MTAENNDSPTEETRNQRSDSGLPTEETRRQTAERSMQADNGQKPQVNPPIDATPGQGTESSSPTLKGRGQAVESRAQVKASRGLGVERNSPAEETPVQTAEIGLPGKAARGREGSPPADAKRGQASESNSPAAAAKGSAGGRPAVSRVRGWVRIPSKRDFKSAAHGTQVTARVGVWLGVAFGLCFVTGVLSHLVQRGPEWFHWPADPVNLYRLTQGIHLLAGIAAVPLLIAKLWSVYPKLFARPVVRSLPHAIERGSILVLSGAAFFELVTGVFNSAQNYVWGFTFVPVHYAVGWIAIGSILVHVAVKLPVIRAGLSRLDSKPAKGVMSRRAFLRSTWLTAGVAVVATAGTTVPLLRDVSPLSLRSGRGPQGLPVNRTARAARVEEVGSDWRLSVVTRRGTTRFSLDELAALEQATEELPIACVEGWSQSATWSGVRIADLLRLAGAEPGARLRVSSLEQHGGYGRSTLPGTHTADSRTLLALRLNGAPLSLDHGYPCRLIAPSRPGVLQTKWVNRLVVI
jgi:DMSO/TMAO reductase YedYZ molybdopterin-dependent catalytic subunit